MRVKVIYRRNLKMSEAKVAAQVAHAVVGLGVTDPTCTIIVLSVSDAKFFEMVYLPNDSTLDERYCFVQKDYGYTEVEEGTQTAAAWEE